jgi:glucose-1-phosphatase
MLPLKNIIFDLGAVLINIDYKKTEAAFIKLGYENFAEMYNQYSANEIFEKLETGLITNEAFYKTIIGLNKKTITASQIKQAWNEILLDWRKDSLDFLKSLSSHYNLFLLSNTNSIHQEEFLDSLKKQTNISDFNSLFSKAYYSHEIHLRKPNEDIFEFVTINAGINKSETLFIDDSYNNIATAKKLGFKTHLLLSHETIEDLNYESY